MFYFKKQGSIRNLKKVVSSAFLGICCSALAATNPLIPSLMEQGMKYYSEKQYNAASDYLGQVVDMEPEHYQARYYLTYSLALAGKNELALKHAEILAKKFPKEAQYKTLVNQIKHQMGEVAAAKGKKGKAVNAKPKDEVIIGGYQSMDKNVEVRSPKVDYTPRDIKPAKPLTELDKAIRKIDEEEYDTAETMLRDILKKEPKNSEVYHNLGVIEMSRNKFKEATKHFSEAAKLDPKNFQTYFLLADCYKNIGQYKKAEAALNSANSIKFDEFALLNLADIELELDDLKKAENIYNQILKKSPDFSEASVGLAKIRLEEGKTEEALTLVNEASRFGNKGESNYVRGLIFSISKLNQEAIEELNAALKEFPNNQKYLLAKARVNLKVGEFNQALTDAATILSANPTSIPAKLIQAEAYIRGSLETEADKILEDIESHGDMGEIHRLRGIEANRRGDVETAKTEYQTYYQMDGNKLAVQFEYAEFLENAEGEREYALDLYNKISKGYADTYYGVKAKEAIKRIFDASENGDDKESADDADFSNSLDSEPSLNFPPEEAKF